MSRSREAGQFFEGYAHDFDAIYGGTGRVGLRRLLDDVFRKSMRLRFERTLEECGPAADKTILDVGCGPGHYGVTLASAGASRVVMLDPAQEMLNIASERASQAGVSDRCEFVHATFDAYRPDKRFDFCILMGLMDYIAEPEDCVRHAVDLTRGKIFLSFPVSGGLLAAVRRRRYRNRTPLYLYREQQLHDLMNRVAPGHYTIERMARDFFATVDAAEVHGI